MESFILFLAPYLHIWGQGVVCIKCGSMWGEIIPVYQICTPTDRSDCDCEKSYLVNVLKCGAFHFSMTSAKGGFFLSIERKPHQTPKSALASRQILNA